MILCTNVYILLVATLLVFRAATIQQPEESGQACRKRLPGSMEQQH